MNRFFLLLIFVLLVLSSCRTQKDVLYFQNLDTVLDSLTTEHYIDPVIQTGDALSIVVSAFNPDLARPFNLSVPEGMPMNNVSRSAAQNPISYVVPSNGVIDMPMLGSIKASGKTRQELAAFLEGKISEYIENPIVNVRYLNYRVTMLGEFNKPGVVMSDAEKLSIMEAIALSGDMSMYAIRDSVMLIRTVDGVRSKQFIDLKDANIINSDYYYLKQNDLVYAMPTKMKALEFNSQPIRDGVTILGFFLTLYAIFK